MRAGSRAGTRAGPCAGLAEPRCAGAAVGPFVAVTGGLRRSGTCRAGLSCAGLPIRNRVAARPPRRGRPRPAAAPRASHRRRSAQLAVVAAGRVPRARREGSAAALAYRTSLALEPDPYTAVAHADLLPRQGDATNALATLAALPETDAVLIRRGLAPARRQPLDRRERGAGRAQRRIAAPGRRPEPARPRTRARRAVAGRRCETSAGAGAAEPPVATRIARLVGGAAKRQACPRQRGRGRHLGANSRRWTARRAAGHRRAGATRRRIGDRAGRTARRASEASNGIPSSSNCSSMSWSRE